MVKYGCQTVPKLVNANANNIIELHLSALTLTNNKVELILDKWLNQNLIFEGLEYTSKQNTQSSITHMTNSFLSLLIYNGQTYTVAFKNM